MGFLATAKALAQKAKAEKAAPAPPERPARRDPFDDDTARKREVNAGARRGWIEYRPNWLRDRQRSRWL